MAPFYSSEPENNTEQEITESMPASQMPGQSEPSDQESGDMNAEDNADSEDDEYNEDHPSLLAVTHSRWQERMLCKHGLYDNLPEIQWVAFLMIILSFMTDALLAHCIPSAHTIRAASSLMNTPTLRCSVSLLMSKPYGVSCAFSMFCLSNFLTLTNRLWHS